MKTAAIDLGNTQGKVGLFEGTELLTVFEFKEPELALPLLRKQQPAKIMMSNVGKAQSSFVSTLAEEFEVSLLTHRTPLPIQNDYKTPETLGMDRVAAVIGAQSLFQNQACLVIDLGTCITYDFLTKEGVYVGGGISPGAWLRSKAMHNFTANLPLIDDLSETPLVGKSTQECLKSGVVNGVTAELTHTIEQYQERFGIFNTVLCGGDANFFESQLKAHIFVRQEIVLIGLNAILLYSTSQLL